MMTIPGSSALSQWSSGIQSPQRGPWMARVQLASLIPGGEGTKQTEHLGQTPCGSVASAHHDPAKKCFIVPAVWER
jgi:hypothetical protein